MAVAGQAAGAGRAVPRAVEEADGRRAGLAAEARHHGRRRLQQHGGVQVQPRAGNELHLLRYESRIRQS